MTVVPDPLTPPGDNVKSFRLSLRRFFAVASAVAIGTIGALAVASPASAHHTNVAGLAKCNLATSTWEVTWFINNSESDKTAVLTDVTADPDGSAITDSVIADGTALPADTPGLQWELTGKQTFPGSEDSATLTLDLVTWSNGRTQNDQSRTIEFRGKCDPLYEVKHECDKLIITLKVPERGHGVFHFKLTPNEGQARETALEPGDEPETVTFPGKAGLKVTLEVWKTYGSSVEESEEVAIATEAVVTEGEAPKIAHEPKKWSTEIEWKPENCPTPTGTTPPLAQTGASLGGVLGIGGSLLGIGVALIGAFFVLRRRRTTGGPAA
jgi:hypothetical protein